MTDIAEFLHQFVPCHSDRSPPQKVLSGGDYLTFERQKQAHHALGDGPTPSSRLQGLVPKMEEFHNQAEFLKVIWKHLYSSSSNKSVGTLHAARNTINVVNVTQDPHDNFYPCSEFMDKVTTAYIVTGGLHHFQMEHLTSVPTAIYMGAVGNPYEMIDFFLGHAKQFVDKHVLPEVPKLPAHGLQSNTLACRYCGKLYQRPKAFENTRHVCIDILIRNIMLKTTRIPHLQQNQDHLCISTPVCLHQGRVDTNHLNDLDLEHCNRAFKDGVHTYKGRYTDKTILRVSRSALLMAELCKKYDKLTFCKQSSGRHAVVDPSGDILKLVEQFNAFAALFNEATSHCHREFKNMQDPLSSLNTSDIQNWISESLKVFSSCTYYDI